MLIRLLGVLLLGTTTILATAPQTRNASGNVPAGSTGLNDVQTRDAIKTAAALEGKKNCRTVNGSDTTQDYKKCERLQSEIDRTSTVNYKVVVLAPNGTIGVIAQLCPANKLALPGCHTYVLRQTMGGFHTVLSFGLPNTIGDWQVASVTTKNFYDLIFGDCLSYSWTGSEYKMAREVGGCKKSSLHRIGVKILSMEPLDHEFDRSSAVGTCTAIDHGFRFVGETADGLSLVMRCVTREVSCSFAASPHVGDEDKAQDGKPLRCDAGFHVGETVRLERQENGDYLPLDFTGFDGTYTPADRKHLKAWSVESESGPQSRIRQ